MRTIAIGDIHGGLKALMQLLERLRPDAGDHLIFLGDYVDGWSESFGVIDHLLKLSKKYKCTFLKGNHDIWCADWLQNNTINNIWLEHGGQAAIQSYIDVNDVIKAKHFAFIDQSLPYYLDNNNRLFIHAGFTSEEGVKKEQCPENYFTDRTLWEMAVTLDKNIELNSERYPTRLSNYHEIYIGHTPTIIYGETKPMNAANVWNVDTGAAFDGKLSAIDVDTKEIFQSDKVQQLYPEEKGRN